eukprot:8214731-Heterocapsa_arctica.AAC.1
MKVADVLEKMKSRLALVTLGKRQAEPGLALATPRRRQQSLALTAGQRCLRSCNPRASLVAVSQLGGRLSLGRVER